MKKLVKVSIVEDNDGDSYVIPYDKKSRFLDLLDLKEDGEDFLIEEFSKYMTGGNINLVQLYANI